MTVTATTLGEAKIRLLGQKESSVGLSNSHILLRSHAIRRVSDDRYGGLYYGPDLENPALPNKANNERRFIYSLSLPYIVNLPQKNRC